MLTLMDVKMYLDGKTLSILDVNISGFTIIIMMSYMYMYMPCRSSIYMYRCSIYMNISLQGLNEIMRVVT